MSAPHRSQNGSSQAPQPKSEPHEKRSTPSFDDARRGYGRDEPVDPADPGDGGRIEADRIPPEPIGPSRQWALAAFVPFALLMGALALAIYVWMRA